MEQQQQQQQLFDPQKMLRKRRFLRKSMANFHFDKVLARHHHCDAEGTETTRGNIGKPRGIFTSSRVQNECGRVETKREQNLKRATPWLERVAAMRYFNLGKDHPRTAKVIHHLQTCYQETRRHDSLTQLTKYPSKYLYNLRQDLRSVHGKSVKPCEEEEEKLKTVVEKNLKIQENNDCSRTSERKDKSIIQKARPQTSKPIVDNKTPFRDQLRKWREKRAISSHGKLRRPNTASRAKLRPISRWEYFDIVTEHAQNCTEKRGTLSETVLPSLVRNLSKHRKMRIIPEPTITRKQTNRRDRIEIDLSHFSLGKDRANLLMDVLEEDGELVEKLDLTSNRLASSDLERISKSMPNLRILNMSRNRFENVNRFFKHHSLKHLQNLSLSSCNLDDKSAVHLASILNSSISTLNLSSNRIGAKGAVAIAKLMETSKHLRTLDLSCNSLTVRFRSFFFFITHTYIYIHTNTDKRMQRYRYFISKQYRALQLKSQSNRIRTR